MHNINLTEPHNNRMHHMKFKHFTPYLLVVSVAFLVYVPWINDYFLSDDWRLLARNANLSTMDALRYFVSLQEGRWYRPLYEVSIAWSWSLFALNPAGHHAIGFLFHTANSLLVAIIGTQISSEKQIGSVAGIVFAVFAAHPDAVIWMAGRNELIAGFFVLLSFLAHIQFRKGKSRWLFGTILFYIASLMAKETALPLPAFLILYDLLISSPQFSIRQSVTRWQMLFPDILIAAVGGAYLLFRLQTGIGYNLQIELLLLPKNLVYYLLMQVIALPVSMKYLLQFPVINYGVITLLVSALGLILWLAKKSILKSRTLLFAILWMSFALLPVLPIVSERSVYISSIGCALTWAIGLNLARQAVQKTPSRLRYIGYGIAIIFVVGSHLISLTHRAFWWQQTSIMTQKALSSLNEVLLDLPTSNSNQIWLFNLPGQSTYAHAFDNTFPFVETVLYADTIGDSEINVLLDEAEGVTTKESLRHFFENQHEDVNHIRAFIWENNELVEVGLTP